MKETRTAGLIFISINETGQNNCSNSLPSIHNSNTNSKIFAFTVENTFRSSLQSQSQAF